MADRADDGARELAQLAVEAHGGEQVWAALSHRSVRVWGGGFAFASKLQGHAVRAVEARIATSGQHVSFSDYPADGDEGVLEQDGSVRIERAGADADVRLDARAAFADVRHRLWWDRLDMLYFAASALWTYVSAPFVWLRDDYELRELESWSEGGERWRRLAVTFPAGVHTHCREQVFHIDEAGLIRRHDYTPEPFHNGIRAAHYCYDFKPVDGLQLATRRAVFPRRRDDTARGWPRLVWIELAAPD
jgi:hypothetical protein